MLTKQELFDSIYDYINWVVEDEMETYQRQVEPFDFVIDEGWNDFVEKCIDDYCESYNTSRDELDCDSYDIIKFYYLEDAYESFIKQKLR